MSVEDGIAALQGLLGRVSRMEGMIPQFRWGHVTSVAGLEVQLDGPGLPVPITSTLVRPAVGDRVLVLFWLRRSVILGVAGGGEPGYLVIGGERYRASGTLVATGGTWVTHGSGLLYCTKTAQLPYEPPPGWHFHIAPVVAGSGFLFGGQQTVGSATMRLMGTINLASVTCDWQLIQH